MGTLCVYMHCSSGVIGQGTLIGLGLTMEHKLAGQQASGIRLDFDPLKQGLQECTTSLNFFCGVLVVQLS